MPVTAEVSRRVEKVEIPKGLIVGKALELWEVIAPGRKPDLNRPAGMEFNPYIKDLRERTNNQELFLRIITNYWFDSKTEPVGIYLYVDPKYSGQVPDKKIETSFNLSVIVAPAPQTPYGRFETAMDIKEIPDESLVGRVFPSHDVEILMELTPYSKEGVNYQLIGRKPGRDQTLMHQIYHPKWNSPYYSTDNMPWRREFASDVLDYLKQVAQSAKPGRWSRFDQTTQRIWSEKGSRDINLSYLQKPMDYEFRHGPGLG